MRSESFEMGQLSVTLCGKSLPISSPDVVGIPTYLSSLRRIESKYAELMSKPMRVNQDAARELSDILGHGSKHLRDLFVRLIQDSPTKIESLGYIMKGRLLPCD